ncbi:MAG: DUF4430 domain-containing protein, partial [Lachnospiraceae bacterium]|nr:DUF4430 domain-containing protein [Lachnospiraceae bacterium]
IIMFKMQECGAADTDEWIEKDLIPNAGITAETYAYALAKEDGYDLTAYTAAHSRILSETEVRAATTRLKYALCLTVADRDNPYITNTVNEAVGVQGIMSLVYGLHLYNNGYESAIYPPDKIVTDILGLRHEDGGWSVIGDYSDVDVTAMVLQALAGCITDHTAGGTDIAGIGVGSVGADAFGAGEGSGDTDIDGIEESAGRTVLTDEKLLQELRDAADAAVELLSKKQNADGGYSGFGAANAESTAQVLIALSSLGIDAAEDQRFIKNGNTIFDGLAAYRLTDGTYAHIAGGESNATATMQVFAAMEAYVTMKEGKGPYYVLGETGSEGTGGDRTADGGTVTGTDDTTGKDGRVTGTDSTDSSSSGTDSGNTSTDKDGRVTGTGESTVTGTKDADGGIPAGEQASAVNYKTIAYAVIAGLFAMACALLFIFKKRNYKNFIFAAIIALLAVLVVYKTDISSKEAYYSGTAGADGEIVGTVTLTIRCDSIVGEDSGFIPSDGVILGEKEYGIREGESVYDLLIGAVRENGIHLENKKTSVGAHGAYYISGINHIYEYEYGELSGWMYYVNGEAPSVGCGDYELHDGDDVAWLYTREIGRDIEP